MSQCLRTRNGFSLRTSLRIESLEPRRLLSANVDFAAANTGEVVVADCRDAASETNVTLPVTSPGLTIAEAPTVTVSMPVSDLPEGTFRPFGRPFPPLHVVADTNVAEPVESVIPLEATTPVDGVSPAASGELEVAAQHDVAPADEVILSSPVESTLGSEVLSVDNPAFGETSQQPVDDCDVVGPMPRILEGAAAVSAVVDHDTEVEGSHDPAPVLRAPALTAAREIPTLALPNEKPQDLPIIAQALPTPFESKHDRRSSKAAAESAIAENVGGKVVAARGECAAARDIAFAGLDVRPKARRQGWR